MTLNRHSLPLGLAVLLLIAAAVSTAFLLPPKPDLITRSTKIVDLVDIDTDYLHWLGTHRLIAMKDDYTSAPSIVAIDVSAKTIAPLPRVTHSFQEVIAASHTDVVDDMIVSPDGQWILFCLSGSHSAAFETYAIRVCDGYVIKSKRKGWSITSLWLAGSQSWVDLEENELIVHSLSHPSVERIVPAPGIYYKYFSKHRDVETINALLGNERVFQSEKYLTGRSSDEDGIVSPDGARIAWLRQSDWPDELPRKLRGIAYTWGYRPRTSGDLWTIGIDGTNRCEAGTFRSSSSTPPTTQVDAFNWTPDNKSLIFVHEQALYSVPVSAP